MTSRSMSKVYTISDMSFVYTEYLKYRYLSLIARKGSIFIDKQCANPR